MAYNLEFELSEHVKLLKPLMRDILEEEPNMFIITDDGETVETHKILLSLFSRSLANILSGYPQDVGMPVISVPMKARAVRNLIRILRKGTVFAEEKKDLLQVAKIGKVLGIELQNLQIGGKMKTIKGSKAIEVSRKDDENSHKGNEKEKMEINSEVSKKYECEDCNKSFNHMAGLATHCKVKHLKTLEQNLECFVCEKVFTTPTNLEVHMRIHTGEKPYQCESCDKAFSSQHSLKSHNLTHHDKENSELMKVNCQECGKTLRDKQVLKNHMINIHTEKMPFKCDKCDRCFKQAGNMKQHQLIHSDIKNFECNACEKKFKHKGDLKRHELKRCKH